ncbi:MAG: VWD domain-containing protein [Dyadobacter sp.]|uniref:VWD domain-containing protein n=1 Tax=Dyadobacter sp. TaxID=1914288 RepID=UPI0032677D54
MKTSLVTARRFLLYTLFSMLLPLSCKEKENAPAATSNGPTEIRYHQLIIECTEATGQNKGVAILDFRFDTYADGEMAGYGFGKYIAFGTKDFLPIDAALQTAHADIAGKADAVQAFPTMTDFIVSRLEKVQGYTATKNLGSDAMWGILANEETTIAKLHGMQKSFDFGAFLAALIATPAYAQKVGSNDGLNYHNSYSYSPPPQPGSPLPEYRFVNPVTQGQMPAKAAPEQRNSRGETMPERAAREEAARAAAQAGRTNRGPRNLSDALSGIFDRLGDPLGGALDQGGSAGDPHFRMHDGLAYDLQAAGEFIATKGSDLEIQARQEDVYKTSRATVNTGVAARLGSDQICLLVNPATISEPRLFVNKKETPLSAIAQVSLSGGNKLQIAATTKLVFSNAQNEGVVIYWNTPYLDYAVMLGDSRKGKVAGLLGNYDGNDKNDLVLTNGTAIEPIFSAIHGAFADSWRITNPTSLFVYEAGKNTESYTDRSFPKVLPVVAPDKLVWAEGVCKAAGVFRQPELGHCIFDVGITGDERMVQSALLSQREFKATPEVSTFIGLKVALKEGQSADNQTLNLLDLDNGTFYPFAKGALVAPDIDVVFDFYNGPWFAGPRAVKNCGVSCGAYAIWPRIDEQKWPYFQSTFLRYTTIPASEWGTYGNAADLRRAWTFDAEANESAELVKSLTDLTTAAPLSQNLWSFKTQQGKKGLIRFTQTQVTTGTATFLFDVKVER